MAKNRNYNFKDVDMLMASRTIAGSFKAYIAELSTTRSVWTEGYADDLIARIDNAISTGLGTDSKKELRNATIALSTIQAPARRDVSYFKVQVFEDFKKEPVRRDEILTTLGFTRFLTAVNNGNQEALVQLLSAFKSNMTDTLRNEIMAKGMSAALIDNITGYADAFRQANVTQEGMKGSTKNVSKEVADTFKNIYDEIIGICKIASNFYRFEPLKKQQFTFSKVINNLGAAQKHDQEATMAPTGS
jgi:hypothetical protein